MSKALSASLVMLSVGLLMLAIGLLLVFTVTANEMVMTMTIHLLATGTVLLLTGLLFMAAVTWSGVEVMGEIEALISRVHKTIIEGVTVSKEWLKKTAHAVKVVATDGFNKEPVRTGLLIVLSGAAFIVATIFATNRDFAIPIIATIGAISVILGALIVASFYLCKDVEDSA